MNVCIDVAVESGKDWPVSPISATSELLGVLPESCVSRKIDAEYPVEEAGEYVIILYRDVDGLVGDTGRWYDVHFVELADGTFRIRKIETTASTAGSPAESDDRDLRSRVFHRPAPWVHQSFDWDTYGPIDWIEYLKWRTGTVSIMPVHEDWITQNDVAMLMPMLDSTDTCAAVAHIASSVLEMSHSTVGTEAAFIIEGYRQERYPPWSLSTRAKIDKEEIRKWWREEGGT